MLEVLERVSAGEAERTCAYGFAGDEREVARAEQAIDGSSSAQRMLWRVGLPGLAGRSTGRGGPPRPIRRLVGGRTVVNRDFNARRPDTRSAVTIRCGLSAFYELGDRHHSRKHRGRFPADSAPADSRSRSRFGWQSEHLRAAVAAPTGGPSSRDQGSMLGSTAAILELLQSRGQIPKTCSFSLHTSNMPCLISSSIFAEYDSDVYPLARQARRSDARSPYDTLQEAR